MDTSTQLRASLGEYGQNLSENVVMKDRLPYGLAGVAEYYFAADSTGALTLAIQSATQLNIPWVVLGAGERTIISEFGFQGLIIHNQSKNMVFAPDQSQIIAESGVLVPRLVMEAVSRDLGGLEFLANLRGTLGGALWFNAEQFGYQISQFTKRLTVCFPDGTVESHPASWFKFGRHRHRMVSQYTRFLKKQPIFLSAVLQLHSAKKYELMRRIQFFQKRFNPSANQDQTIFPVFHAPEYQADVDELLKKYFQNESQPTSKCIRLLPLAANAIELRSCRSREIRQWCDGVKEGLRATTGIMLEELLYYVGQW